MFLKEQSSTFIYILFLFSQSIRQLVVHNIFVGQFLLPFPPNLLKLTIFYISSSYKILILVCGGGRLVLHPLRSKMFIIHNEAYYKTIFQIGVKNAKYLYGSYFLIVLKQRMLYLKK